MDRIGLNSSTKDQPSETPENPVYAAYCQAEQNPDGPYRGSKKEPDFFFMSRGRLLPAVTIECGWSETMPRLQNDLNI
ncbi:unnamed protein product [Penicillium palitans]